MTGRPVDVLGISAATWLPANRYAPTQKGGESALTVPDEVPEGGVRGARAVYSAPGAAAVGWQLVTKPLGCNAIVLSPCQAFATAGW